MEGLPQSVRREWHRALKANKAIELMPEELDLGGRLDPDSVVSLTNHVRLLGVDRALGGAFGLTDDVPTRDLGQCGLETSLVDCLDLSRTMEEVQALADAPIRAGTPVEDVWRQRLEPVLRVTTRLTIVDRYALERVERDKERAGLCQLLRRLTEGVIPKYVKVLSQGPVSDSIRRAIGSRVPTTIEVLSVPAGAWKCQTADRWIQADRYAIEIGHGLEVLEREQVGRLNTFSFKRVSRDHEDAALRLSRACVARTVFSAETRG
jgi:hypothetical protein